MPHSASLPVAAALGALGLVLLPVLGQAQEQDLQRPEGWNVRFDDPNASEDQLEMFVTMPPGWHVTSGPAAVYWGPEMEASGEYRLEMEVFLFDPQGRREAFGIFFGGRDMMGEAIEYAYFLIRDGGEFTVKRRKGPQTQTILRWAGHDSIVAYADRGEAATAKNVLAVQAGGETVRFFVNGAEVASLPRADVAADGIFGFRINHGLDVHVSRMEMVTEDGGGLALSLRGLAGTNSSPACWCPPVG